MRENPWIGGRPVTAWAEASPSSTNIVPGSVRVTNVRDGGFTVSWLTTESVTGAIRYGLSPGSLSNTAYDDRGDNFSGRTHHVSLGNLLPETWYYYDILSGDTVDDNGGVHYIYATGPTLWIPSVQGIYGQVVTGTGQPLPGSVLYAVLSDMNRLGSMGTSAPYSSLAKEQGYWQFNLPEFREGDFTAYFSYSGTVELVNLVVVGEPDGVGQDTFTPSQADLSQGVSRTVTVTAGIAVPIPPAPPPISPGPDLAVIGLTSGTPLAGCPFIIAINNQGGAIAKAPFRVALYLDHSRVPYPGERSNINTYSVVTEDLGAGSSRQLAVVIEHLLPQGNHTLYAQVDSYNNLVGETDENNNIFGPVQVQAKMGCRRVYLPLVLRNY